jgi:hypothetical protein
MDNNNVKNIDREAVVNDLNDAGSNLITIHDAPITNYSNAPTIKNDRAGLSHILTAEDVLRYINGDDSEGDVPDASWAIDEPLQKLPANDTDSVEAEFSEDDPSTWAVKPFIPVTALDWRIKAHHDAMRKMNDLSEYLEITKLDKSERAMWGKLLKEAFKLTLKHKR